MLHQALSLLERIVIEDVRLAYLNSCRKPAANHFQAQQQPPIDLKSLTLSLFDLETASFHHIPLQLFEVIPN
jgi:hypothetical protein